MPKICYSVEDGQEIALKKFYDFPKVVRCVEQTEEAKEILVFKEDGDDHGPVGCYWIRENEDNKGILE